MNSTFLPIQPSDISYSQMYSSPVSVEQAHSPGLSLPPNTMLLVILCSLALGMIWYKKHRAHCFMLEQQRSMLERMWQLNSTK